LNNFRIRKEGKKRFPGVTNPAFLRFMNQSERLKLAVRLVSRDGLSENRPGRDSSHFMSGQNGYFVWRNPATTDRFRVVHREVKLRTHKGYPISFALKALPGEYASWENAQQVAERLNRGEPAEEDWSPGEEEEVEA
jgi:hypothetical protein